MPGQIVFPHPLVYVFRIRIEIFVRNTFSNWKCVYKLKTKIKRKFQILIVHDVTNTWLYWIIVLDYSSKTIVETFSESALMAGNQFSRVVVIDFSTKSVDQMSNVCEIEVMVIKSIV